MPTSLTDNTLFTRFRPALEKDAPLVVRDPRLLLDESGDIKIYYAPFEYLNPEARIVLVGITPGPTQMVNANNEARRMLRAGAAAQVAMKAAKDVAAFSGEPMRGNLIRQLNHWGFPQWLGLGDAAELFSTARQLVQTTSLLRFPVFIRDADYRGTPDMLKDPLLREHLMRYFAEEVGLLDQAVFIGLGPQVQRVLDELARQRLLPKERLVGGMLHPSGNCTYRINYMTGGRKGPTPHATNPVPYDRGRTLFREMYLRGWEA